jgi:uncharacterized protein with PQ loop repeat
MGRHDRNLRTGVAPFRLSRIGILTSRLGVALWLAYGLMVVSWPVIVCNAITLVLAGGVLALKLRHR